MRTIGHKRSRQALVYALAAALVGLFSPPHVAAEEVKGREVVLTANVPPITATTPTLLTVSIDGQKIQVGGDTVRVVQGGTLTLKLVTTTGVINVTRETAACPEGEQGAVILVTGAITNVTGTATFTPTGDFAGLEERRQDFGIPNRAGKVQAAVCGDVDVT